MLKNSQFSVMSFPLKCPLHKGNAGNAHQNLHLSIVFFHAFSHSFPYVLMNSPHFMVIFPMCLPYVLRDFPAMMPLARPAEVIFWTGWIFSTSSWRTLGVAPALETHVIYNQRWKASAVSMEMHHIHPICMCIWCRYYVYIMCICLYIIRM